MMENRVRILAFYLPQFHPTPENDKWWGKGFTEWTNVGKAKPLFKGHYQPKVPADLGYYDLRMSEAREAQAELARTYGIEGFLYWHYWFGNGQRLLERPFEEVLQSGKPDFPFCLGWANHSWEDKQFSKEGSHKMLMKQTYPGDEDYLLHFRAILPALKDSRYVKVHGKPFFMIYAPDALPDATHFISLWQKEARKAGLSGIHFVAHTNNPTDVNRLKEMGFDAVVVVRMFEFMKHRSSLLQKIVTKVKRYIFGLGGIFEYNQAAQYFVGEESRKPMCYPTIISNWDHSPRSGRKGHIFINSTPEEFKKHCINAFSTIKEKEKEDRIVILKSWNEWAEGNYVEPDLKYGHGFLKAIKESIEEVFK